jgi:hypothetical protein
MEIGIGMPVATGIELEGRLAIGQRPEVAIIAHPHPEYGGSMDNNVVFAVREVAGALGMTTLRFNFRGVGASSGRYDDGLGEVDDLLVAVETGRRRAAADCRVHLVAYSFGAWIAAKAVTRGLRVENLVLISPPVDFLAFGGLGLPECPCHVITGAKDEYGSPASVKAWLDRQPEAPELQVVPGADHFYFGMEASLVALLGGFLS